MNSRSWCRFLNVLAFGLVIVVNILANLLPLGGQTTKEISDKYPVLFTPAPYVFSIWGLIYVLLLLHTVYQALPAQQTNPYVQRVGCLFALTSVLNASWLFAWHYDRLGLSVLLMVGLLVTLVAIYMRLPLTDRSAPASARLFVGIPFSVYLGWITVATVANIAALLYAAGWSGWGLGPEAWTVIMMAVAVLIAAVAAVREGDITIGGVVIWALVGIAAARSDVALVQAAAYGLAGALGALLLATVIRGLGSSAASA